jgi:lactate dehydrogenase-like 2-hydroxyacid dehydrogenase
MPTTDRPKIALFGSLPPQVPNAVAQRSDLILLSEVTPEQAAQITLGLTSAMNGASKQMLDALPRLEKIVSCGAGLDRFDFDEIKLRGIAFHHTGHLMTQDTAEMAVALVFALLRQVLQNDAHVRSGAWAERRADPSTRLSGKRVGIVGLGKIGHTIAQMLSPLGMTVSYTGPNAKPDVPWVYQPDLLQLSRDVDILILACSGGPATRHLVNAPVLAALGKGGFLVNVARGSVVDEDALIHALETGEISGAGLDVFEREPTPDPRFSRLDTVVLQPHSATLTHENRAELVTEVLALLGLPA